MVAATSRWYDSRHWMSATPVEIKFGSVASPYCPPTCIFFNQSSMPSLFFFCVFCCNICSPRRNIAVRRSWAESWKNKVSVRSPSAPWFARESRSFLVCLASAAFEAEQTWPGGHIARKYLPLSKFPFLSWPRPPPLLSPLRQLLLAPSTSCVCSGTALGHTCSWHCGKVLRRCDMSSNNRQSTLIAHKTQIIKTFTRIIFRRAIFCFEIFFENVNDNSDDPLSDRDCQIRSFNSGCPVLNRLNLMSWGRSMGVHSWFTRVDPLRQFGSSIRIMKSNNSWQWRSLI